MQTRVNDRRRGAAFVELAVVLPLMILLFTLSADYGRVFYFSQVLTECAKDGALYLSDPRAPANNLYSNVQDAALSGATDLRPQPTVISTTGHDSAGDPFVLVTVTWTFRTVTGFPGVPNNTILQRTCQMRQAPQ